MTLPNFIVIGAGKGGTTSLYHALKGHPEIHVSPVKETNFFAYEGGDSCRLAWGARGRYRFPVRSLPEYEALFARAGGRKAVGEVSPLYLESAAAPRRMHETLPDARLVAILRNPVDRAYSSYLMQVREGTETRDAAEAFAEPLKESTVQGGFYHALLAPYFALFPADRIRLVLFERFKADPQAVTKEIFRFLQVSDTAAPDLGKVHNPGGLPRWRGVYRLLTDRRLVSAMQRMLPRPLYRGGRIVLDRILVPPPPLPDALRRRLNALYRNDILRLQDSTGLDLAPWLSET